MSFPARGHTRMRGYFHSPDTGDANVRLMRFVDPGLPPPRKTATQPRLDCPHPQFGADGVCTLCKEYYAARHDSTPLL